MSGRHPPAFSADQFHQLPCRPKREGKRGKGAVGPGRLSAGGSKTESGEGGDGARPASPALLQRWSVMIRRSSPRVSRAMSSELCRPPPRFSASTKLSILSDNSEPLASAPGISKEAASPAESTPARPPGLHFRGRRGRLPLWEEDSSLGDGRATPLAATSRPATCQSQSETWSSICSVTAERPRASEVGGAEVTVPASSDAEDLASEASGGWLDQLLWKQPV